MSDQTPEPGSPAAPDDIVAAAGRWGRRVVRIVLGIGAVAGSLGAIIALVVVFLPARRTADGADITSVRATAGIPLSEFHQRALTLTAHPVVATMRPAVVTAIIRPVADVSTSTADAPTVTNETPSQSDVTPTDGQSATNSAISTDSDSPTSAVPTATGSPTAQPATGPQVDSVPTPSDGTVRAWAGRVIAILKNRDPVDFQKLCPPPQPCDVHRLTDVLPVILSPTDPDNTLTDPAVAAEQAAQILQNTRTSGTGSARTVTGVDISASVELHGLKGRTTMLYWSVWQSGGATRLGGQWLADHPAYRMKATTDDDTASVDWWIPLPAKPGTYFVRVDVRENGTPIASTDSNSFS